MTVDFTVAVCRAGWLVIKNNTVISHGHATRESAEKLAATLRADESKGWDEILTREFKRKHT